jgi:hypothetical protein
MQRNGFKFGLHILLSKNYENQEKLNDIKL